MSAERLKVVFRHVHQPSGALTTRPTAGWPSFDFSPRTFQYTVPNPRLTEAQRIQYEENGFVVIPDLVPGHLLDKYRDRFLDFCEGRVDRGHKILMKDISLAKLGAKGEMLYNKLQDFVYDEVLWEYCQLPQLVDYVECFTGPNVVAVHSMLINKPPDSGSKTSRHPLHQDLHYFPFRPADKVVCAWTAMEDVNAENGCLVVLPGTHKGELLQHEYPEWEGGVNKGYHGVKVSDMSMRHHVLMSKGDTVFFHPILIHGSGTNRTKGFRKAISCHYAGSECYYIDVRGTTQENIAREVEEIATKRGLSSVDYRDVWKYRMRQVKGECGTLLSD